MKWLKKMLKKIDWKQIIKTRIKEAISSEDVRIETVNEIANILDVSDRDADNLWQMLITKIDKIIDKL